MLAIRSGQRPPVMNLDVSGNTRQLDAMLFDLLKPRNMGVIPIQFLILSLVVYILLIGPGDYYVLGWFKARRFTWILFPLLTVCFSWGMLRLTNYVMGTNDRLSKIRIVDLDQAGKVLRENEISLLMYSTPKREQIEVASGLVTRLQNTPFGVERPGFDSRRWERGRPIYIGRTPSRYRVQIDAEQWNPERYRTVKFESTNPVPEFPWEKYLQSELMKPAAANLDLMQAFQRDLFKTFGDSTKAMVYTGATWSDLSPDNHPEIERTAERRALMELCAMKPVGESSWLHRVSPLGSESYDDLAILETLDNRHSVLGILMHQGEDLTLYRILLRREDGNSQGSDIPSGGELQDSAPLEDSPPVVPSSSGDP